MVIDKDELIYRFRTELAHLLIVRSNGVMACAACVEMLNDFEN